MNIAVILAGGSGSRLGADRPKQFLQVAGKTILEHTLDVFDSDPHIDEIVVVTREGCIDDVRRMTAADRYTKVRRVLCGGRERYHSSLAAIEACTDDDDNLLFHDAVRPLVSHAVIDRCVQALREYSAVGVGVRATDTIMRVDGRECVSDILPRNELRCAQTPQCFRRGVIREAYERALQDPTFTTTDDCGVVMRYMPEVAVRIVEGDVLNMKITYKEDLLLLERLLQAKGV